MPRRILNFRAWLATIDFQGAVCAPPPPPPPSPGGGGGGPPSGGGGPRQTVPDTPTNLMADATDGTVTLAWEAPKDDGGSAVTDYQYRINSRGDCDFHRLHQYHAYGHRSNQRRHLRLRGAGGEPRRPEPRL